jgi:hypothetical protein
VKSDPCADLLRAAVGFALVPLTEPELRLLHHWMDSWRGIGDVVAVMAPQGYDLELRRYNGRGWRAMFFPSGLRALAHFEAGSAWALSPWEAVQRAAGDAPRKRERGEAAPRDWTISDESPR